MVTIFCINVRLVSLSQLKLYNSVIEDVISGVREAFLDEGVDDQVLQELKSLWEMKLLSNKAVEPNPEPLDPAPPQLGQKSNSKSGKFSLLIVRLQLCSLTRSDSFRCDFIEFMLSCYCYAFLYVLVHRFDISE